MSRRKDAEKGMRMIRGGRHTPKPGAHEAPKNNHPAPEQPARIVLTPCWTLEDLEWGNPLCRSTPFYPFVVVPIPAETVLHGQ